MVSPPPPVLSTVAIMMGCPGVLYVPLHVRRWLELAEDNDVEIYQTNQKNAKLVQPQVLLVSHIVLFHCHSNTIEMGGREARECI